MKNRYIWGAALAVLFACGAGPPATSCTDIDADASKYKIVIGKLKYTVNGDTTSVTENHSMAIRSAMWSRFGNLSENTIPAVCADRFWNEGGHDHVDAFVEGLNDRNVLLELWGVVSEAKTDTNTTYRANVCMVLIPVRHHEKGNVKIDFCLLSLSREGVGDFVTAVTDMILGTEFEVYVYIAHAYKAFQNDEFAAAKSFLGKASLTMASEKGEQINTQLAEGLTGYIDDMSEIILEADPTLVITTDAPGDSL